MNNTNVETKVIKKRGRKPKTQNDELVENSIPKKRGRKPKQKSEEEENVETKTPKKRGRKPKEKIYSVSSPVLNVNENIDENIILHLPISQYSIDNIDCDSLLAYNMDENQEAVEPNPYEPEMNYQMISGTNNKKTIKKIEEDMSKETKKDPENLSEILQTDDNKEKKLIKRNLVNIMYEFIDGNNRTDWPKNTNIYCMWCCHPFDSVPCALPEKMLNNKFYLSGCYCSFNCAAAHNFDQKKYNMWESYTLLNLLYKKIYETAYIKIKLAPPRNVLKIFGGFLNVEEFRKNFLINKEYSVILPPMISLVPTIEEHIFEDINNNSLYIPLDEDDVQKATLKLKREKPLTDPRKTLESYMDLKIL